MTNIPWRGILFYSFVAFFIIASVVLVLYGTGYRYSSSKRTLEKTGELIMESQPKGATVFIDGKDTGKKTPLHLKYILPGTYRLTVTKEGYLPFTREISISSGIVTIVNDVVLIKDLAPTLLFSYPGNITELSAITSQNIFFKTDTSFLVYERASKKVKELLRTTGKIKVVSLEHSQSFYVTTDTKAYVVKKNTGAYKQVGVPLPGMHSLVWTESEELFGITPKGIITYNPNTLESEYFARGVFYDVLVYSETITALEERNGTFLLLQIDQAKKDNKKYVYDIPKNARRFVKNAYPFVIIQTEQGEFFNVEAAKVVSSAPIEEIQRFVFPSSDARVAVSDFEIWLFEEGTIRKNKRLVLRRADPITHTALIPSAPYVLVAGSHDLELLEIGNHSTPNRYELVRSQYISDSTFLPKENKIFFSESMPQQSKVYERLLIE